MPHKNPNCPRCGWKTKHHKWVSKNERLSKINRHVEVWDRIVKCPNCGTEVNDWKARWGHRSEVSPT